MTPRQLSRYYAGLAIRRRDELKSGLTLAWYGAAFERSKKLPALDKIYERIDRATGVRKKVMTWQAMAAVAKGYTQRINRDRRRAEEASKKGP